ncbi:MAG TPA: molybdopterin cofactor-binding domain-containing protein, partial [Acidimicrobiia bacterium]
MGDHDSAPFGDVSRRRFLGFLIAGPTLVTAAQLPWGLLDGPASRAYAAISSPPEPADLLDLSDLLTAAAAPTANLIKVVVNADGTVSFALPRAEVGQGITTAVAMTIADEMGLAISKVSVTLADARPELVWNQLTGGSNSMHSIFTPVRVAAAAARQQLAHAAAGELGVEMSSLRAHDGTFAAPNGRSVAYGSLARSAAVAQSTAVPVELKATSNFTIVGKPQKRIEARDIVTGRKQFTMDLDVPGALPTMVCRPPTIDAKAVSIANAAAVKAMPGVTDVVVVPSGVAVRAATFGQCIDAVRALRVTWTHGTAGTKSDANVVAELKAAELPFLATSLPLLTKTIDHSFTFTFASNSPLETNCAVADVRSGRAEIWSSLKSPIVAQETIAEALGLPVSAVTCHVVQGGGSFGRHLFFDAALEAAHISKAIGKPVKLMWHRTDDFRQGRAHPMATAHVRASYLGTNVLAYEHRHTSVATDFSHGLGEILSAEIAKLPEGDTLGYSQAVFNLSQTVPYNFGVLDLALNEVDMGFNTGSMRNIYSPDVVTATELVVDQLAKTMGIDAYQFRRQFLRDSRLLAVLDKVAQVGRWGRAMPAGTAQGLGLHSEYKSCVAALVEIDCTSRTVNRPLPDGIEGVTGPRVTRVVMAVDAGLPINPLGLQAQMMGGAMDGIARVLTFSLHLHNGFFQEGSWDNTFYTREWNAPLDLQVIVMPPTSSTPGGAGELGVAPVQAAVACAYARATAT